jgi:hypothetical protein
MKEMHPGMECSCDMYNLNAAAYSHQGVVLQLGGLGKQLVTPRHKTSTYYTTLHGALDFDRSFGMI